MKKEVRLLRLILQYGSICFKWGYLYSQEENFDKKINKLDEKRAKILDEIKTLVGYY
jgi:uncharacterized Rmd1/YagE family protein